MHVLQMLHCELGLSSACKPASCIPLVPLPCTIPASCGYNLCCSHHGSCTCCWLCHVSVINKPPCISTQPFPLLWLLQAVTVGTCRGQVPVLVVLAGARIIKVLPDRQACAQLLAGQQAQGQGGSTQADAAAVDALVAEAQQAFHDGLEAGDIALPLYDWL